MATLKQRLHKKNSSGTYDTIHLETSASLVLMANGTTVEAAINSKAASSHKHAASNITSGTLAVARGGTGVTNLDALRSALGISGSGGGLLPQILVSAIPGVTITCKKGDIILTAQEINGIWTFDIPEYGEWTVSIGEEELETILVDAVKQYILGNINNGNYTMLYYLGDECKEVTGGLQTIKYGNATTSIVREETTIYVKSNTDNWGSIGAATVNPMPNNSFSCLCAFVINSSPPKANEFNWTSFYMGTAPTGTTENEADVTYIDVVTNKVCICSNKANPYPFIATNPGAHVRFSAFWWAKADDWGTLCEKAAISKPASISALVNNTNFVTTILSNLKATYFMCTNCTGDFLAYAIRSSVFLTTLKASPYKELVYANEHWAKFLALVQ